MSARSGLAAGARQIIHAEPHSGCFVCGKDNPGGLGLVFQRLDNGRMKALWSPGSRWEGFRGIVHGGVVSTVLDEAMSKSVAAAGCEALTAELRMRFRRPVQSGGLFQIQGWIVRRSKRLIEAEAVLESLDGLEYAHAWARFLSLPDSRAPLLRVVTAPDDGDHFEVDFYETPELPGQEGS
ncbi:PaaI family thioesterase [Paludibaculum fermentans]|uniref:PaaI family thioesterase n=1 Tax=Paludibaculum fermentans TaxID=1473598 RepID=UPI003EBB33EA